MGIQSFLIFGDNCRFFFMDMGYFLKNEWDMGYWDPPSRASEVEGLYYHVLNMYVGCSRNTRKGFIECLPL